MVKESRWKACHTINHISDEYYFNILDTYLMENDTSIKYSHSSVASGEIGRIPKRHLWLELGNHRGRWKLQTLICVLIAVAHNEYRYLLYWLISEILPLLDVCGWKVTGVQTIYWLVFVYFIQNTLYVSLRLL